MNFLYLIAILPVVIKSQTLNKFQWNNCGSSGVSLYEIDITPMPIVQPGSIDLTFVAEFKRAMSGNLNTKLTISRTVSGLKLPIRCYLALGVYVGSCDYEDLCKIIEALFPSFTPETCPSSVAEYGIDCNCPFNLKTNYLIDIAEHVEVPAADSSIFSFLASGDFDIKIESKDKNGPYACLEIKFSVKPF